MQKQKKWYQIIYLKQNIIEDNHKRDYENASL